MDPASNQVRRRWYKRSSRIIPILFVVSLAIAVPVAWASFIDVPPSNPFYNDINAIQGAGITQGCGGGNFCPTDNIQRQAEAAFLHRGLGRVGAGGGFPPLTLTGTFQDLAVASITTGGIAGGTGFVIATGDFTAYGQGQVGDDRIAFVLSLDGAGASTADWATLYASGSATPSTTVSKTLVWVVNTATTYTFRLQAQVATGADTILAQSRHITLLYVPFGSTGTSAP